MKNRLSVILLIVILILSSCSSFNKNLKNLHPLNSDNLSELNGKYSIINQYHDSLQKYSRKSLSNNLISELDRKLLKDTLKIDTLNDYKVELKIIDKKKINIHYIKNDEIFRTRTLKTRLKKDGYLYLKNNNVKSMLVPYIAGAIDIKKSRLGLTKSNNLIFDVSHHTSGAMLLIIFLDGRTRKYRHEYKNISNIENLSNEGI